MLVAAKWRLRFHEDEIDGCHEAESGGSVVPVELLVLEEDVGNGGEDHQRDALLDDLELHQREGSAVVDEANAVGGYLTAVLQQGYHPGKGDDHVEGPVGGNA